MRAWSDRIDDPATRNRFSQCRDAAYSRCCEDFRRRFGYRPIPNRLIRAPPRLRRRSVQPLAGGAKSRLAVDSRPPRSAARRRRSARATGLFRRLASSKRRGVDPAFAAQALVPPSDIDISREKGETSTRTGRSGAIGFASRASAPNWLRPLDEVYARLTDQRAYSPDAASAGRRALRNVTLDFIAAGDPSSGGALASRQFGKQET